MRINDNNVKVRVGKALSGDVKYIALSKVMQGTIPTLDREARVSFTTTADSNVKVLTTGEVPSGKVFINGSTLEAIQGGVACASIAGTLGTAETTANTIGGRIINIVRILDVDNDDVLKVEYESGELKVAKDVFGLLQTDISDGGDVQADHIQVSFVIYDDAQDKFVTTTIPAGTYKFEVVRMYNLASVSEVNRLGAVLAGDMGLGGVSIEELKDLLSAPHGYTTITIDTEQVLDSAVITCTITGATTTEWKDSAGNDITGTQEQSGNKRFSAKSINSKAYVKEGIRVLYNGVETSVLNVTVKADNQLEIDLSNDLDAPILYSGDTLEVVW